MEIDALDENKKVKIEQRTGCLWITFPQTIDVQDYVKIEDEIKRNLSTSSKQVVFDFSKVQAIYSSGLGILVRTRQRVADAGGNVYIVNIARHLIDLFISLNLDRVFAIFATEVEFEISIEEIWRQRLTEKETKKNNGAV